MKKPGPNANGAAQDIPADQHHLFDDMDCRPDFARDTGHKNMPVPDWFKALPDRKQKPEG